MSDYAGNYIIGGFMVLDTYIPGTYTCTHRGCKYYLNNDVTSVMIAHRGNKKYKIECTLKTGFQTDGASVPWLFSWFVPKWSSDTAYNMAAMLHDAMYGEKGFGILSREECDDLYRGMLRNCGIGRFKAGVVDKCIELFGGNKTHWGNYGPNAGLVSCKIIEI